MIFAVFVSPIMSLHTVFVLHLTHTQRRGAKRREAKVCDSTHHLLHTVPVNQCVRVSEVSVVVLLISHHKLATGTHKIRKHVLLGSYCIV